jgi:hypothetical protein
LFEVEGNECGVKLFRSSFERHSLESGSKVRSVFAIRNESNSNGFKRCEEDVCEELGDAIE